MNGNGGSQGFTAFGALSPTLLIIDDPVLDRLSDRLDQAEMAIRAGKPVDP